MTPAGGKRLAAVAVMSLLAWLMAGAAAVVCASDRPKAETLGYLISEMATARKGLAERGAAAGELRHRLHACVRELRSEIDRERQQHAVGQFQQALRVERIGNNLRLVQRLYGYLERIDRRIDYLRVADHTLEYTMRRAQDDLRMVRVLEDSEISGLLSQVEAVLSEAARETATPLFNASDPPSRSLESVWNDLTRTP
ncbi:MAG: hypothetical protein MUD16_01610 [Desulfobacterales bacterium]|jgi:hypothetical protein|nr:hypothetical protein [Desulfobacterales bacterium]